MIELAIAPLDGVVTLFAVRRKSRVRNGSVRIIEIVLVARNASRVGDVVVVIDMAIRALPRRHSVRSGERELGLRVIERSRLPGRS